MLKISRLIFISISFILLLFSITTYINYRQSLKVKDDAAFFAESTTFVRQTNQLQRNILDMERNLRGFLITGEDYLLQTYESARMENSSIFSVLSQLSQGRENQLNKLDSINILYDLWLQKFVEPLKTARRHSDSSSLSSLAFQNAFLNDRVTRDEEKVYQNLQRSFSELRDNEYINRDEKRKILEDSEQQTKYISFSLTGLSIFTGFLIAFLLAKHISRRILKMVHLADSIAAGDYDAKVSDNSHDELSKLSHSLNNMARTLSENISLLQRKNQELDQFAHIVSHDLKAPLRGIDNLIAWIEEDYGKDIPDKVSEYLQLIKGRIIRLENLIQGILTYARIGKEEVVKEKIIVKDLIEEILENLEIKSGMKVDISNELPVIQADKIPLSQVFTNLISNALKYHNKKDGTVKVYSKEYPGYYEFFVEDDGPGISPSYHERIFIIFQTLQERDSFESTGIGLAIIKKILDDRKQTIRLISEPGKGSVFSFTWTK